MRATFSERWKAWSERQEKSGHGGLPNLGFGGTIVAGFVSSFFAARVGDAFFVIAAFGPHAFFVDGLRIADWKHGVLSTGVKLPLITNLLRGPLTMVFWIFFIGAAEYSAGSLTAFLARQPRWITAVARFFGGCSLLSFVAWLCSRPGGTLFHPIALAAFIGGIVLMWKGVASVFRSE